MLRSEVPRWWVVVAMLAATVVSWPALGGGFFGDDYVFLGAAAGDPPCTCRPLGLYEYANGQPEATAALVWNGTFPWWTANDLRISLWRPLTSALLQLDHVLFGEDATGYHAHSLGWYLALIGVVGAVFRRALPGRFGGLALLVFAVDESHWLTVSWISNRHALVSAVFAFTGLWAHLERRERRWGPGLPVACAAFVAGLSAGESGIQGLAYVVAYEVVGRRDPWQERARELLPASLIGFGYLVAYSALGHGAHAAGAFVHPLADPGRFVARAMLIAPAMVAELHFGTEVLYGTSTPAHTTVAAVTAIALCALAFAVTRSIRAAPPERARAVRWMALGLVLALAPPIASMREPSGTGRSLMFASVGSAVVVAALLAHGFELVKAGQILAPWNRALAPILGVVATMNLAVEPLAARWGSRKLGEIAAQRVEAIRALDPPADTTVVLLTEAKAITGLASLIVEPRRAPIRRWWNASWSRHALELRPTGERRFELWDTEGAFLEGDTERFHRASPPPSPGARFATELFEVVVLASDRRGPTRLQFTLDRPIRDPSLAYLAWTDGALRQVQMPAIGEVLRVGPVVSTR